MEHVIPITGASSGFGRLCAEALAEAGHTVYASMRGTTERNASTVAAMAEFAQLHDVDLRTVELDVASQDSANAAIDEITRGSGRIDVVLHNAGHMAYGPAEAFSPKQLADLYDSNVVGTQRVNQAVLPHLRGPHVRRARRSSAWSMRQSVHDRSGSTSTRRRTAPT
jgi:NAD(P)-dependent dehydrogenase (short-subunit alcohol dehydrogenase family)